MFKVIKENCIRCEECINICPFGAIETAEDTIKINENCNKCGACADACPAGAIKI